jgi:hypothetical protein
MLVAAFISSIVLMIATEPRPKLTRTNNIFSMAYPFAAQMTVVMMTARQKAHGLAARNR